MPSSNPDRLRQHPSERFASPVHAFDLAKEVAALRGEPYGGGHGHRQKALYRHGDATIALFIFDSGAKMEDPGADGVVVIQVLEGELEVACESQSQRIQPGGLVTLSPGLVHSISARGAAVMLLTVSHARGEASR